MNVFVKAVVLASVVLFLTSQSSAQSSEDSQSTRFGLGLNLGTATSETHKLVIGGDIRLQKDFASNVSGIISAGYTNFSLKSGAPGKPYNVIPLKFGLKVFPVERFYLSGEIGAGFGINSGSRTAFVYAPGLGIGFNFGIDLGLRYEVFTSKVNNNPSQAALRVAYGFDLSKK